MRQSPVGEPAATAVNQSRRLLLLAAVRDGMARGGAAKIGGMDRQTLRDWVHRFNASGPEGLIDNWTDGPKPRLSAEQLAEFAQIVEAGPDREKDEGLWAPGTQGGSRRLPGGAEGIRTSDLRSTGTRALTALPLPRLNTAEGTPLGREDQPSAVARSLKATRKRRRDERSISRCRNPDSAIRPGSRQRTCPAARLVRRRRAFRQRRNSSPDK